MNHVAIMSQGVIPLIISGKKSIESRWYLKRNVPWDRISRGDEVYFKEVGGKVKVKAIVDDVKQFILNRKETVDEIIESYGEGIGVFNESWYSKRYCVLVFLIKINEIKPFSINKKGYGSASAWMCVENIDSVRLNI